jgi:hypothetical protein
MTTIGNVLDEFTSSERAQSHYDGHDSKRDNVAENELQPLIQEFQNEEIDIAEFRSRIDGLNKRNQLWGFDGFVGQMHFNKLVNAAPDNTEFGNRLRQAIQPPETNEEAREKINSFAELTQRYKENDLDSDPFPKSTIFFLSYFWHIQDRTNWPIFYPTSEQYLDEQELLDTDLPYGERYVSFVETLDNLIDEYTAVTEYRDIANAIYYGEEGIGDDEEQEEEEEPTWYPDEERPYLPPVVSDLDMIASGAEEVNSRYAPVDSDLATIFERKCATVFEMLGFDTEVMGQGSGRNPDGIATAVRNDYAVIYDAKKRQSGYRIGRDDRTIREYIETHTRRLRDQGKKNIYFAIISSSFRDVDESNLREVRISTDIDNIVLLRADLIQELLQLRLEEPYLNLDDIEWIFSNRQGEVQSEELENIIPDWRQ